MSELPATMRAAVLHGQLDLTIEERVVPTVGPRDVMNSLVLWAHNEVHSALS